MKRITAVILLAIMIMTLSVGCKKKSSELKEPSIEGKWKTTMQMADFFNGEVAKKDSVMAEYISISNFEIEMIYTFSSDGTYMVESNGDSVKAAYEKIKEEINVGMRKYMEAIIKEGGHNLTVDKFLEDKGITFDVMTEELLGAKFIDELIIKMHIDGKYELEEDKLYTSGSLENAIDKEEYDKIELTFDKLKLVEGVGKEDLPDGFYPITFIKVQ